MRKQQKPEMGHIYKPSTGFHEPVLFKSQNLFSLSLFFIDALTLRQQPLQGQAAELVSPAWLPWQFELQLPARLYKVTPSPTNCAL